jgi:hypothetical protein
MKRSPINRVSKKRKSLDAERKATREMVLARDMNRCQAFIYGCTLHATDVHEIKSRARGGNIVAIGMDLSNFLSLCRSCHNEITQRPAFAEKWGFSVPSWSSPAEYRKAERARAMFRKGIEPDEIVDEEYDDEETD